MSTTYQLPIGEDPLMIHGHTPYIVCHGRYVNQHVWYPAERSML